MPVFSINYTLKNKTAKDYTAIEKAVIWTSNGNYLQCLDSFWLIVSDAGVSQIFDDLAQFMTKDDRLIVMEVGKDYKCFLPKKSLDWIRQVIG